MEKKQPSSKSKDEKVLSFLLSGRAGKKYKGKQVVVFNGEVYILPEGDQEAAQFVSKLRKKNKKVMPILTFVPREETYIL